MIIVTEMMMSVRKLRIQERSRVSNDDAVPTPITSRFGWPQSLDKSWNLIKVVPLYRCLLQIREGNVRRCTTRWWSKLDDGVRSDAVRGQLVFVFRFGISIRYGIRGRLTTCDYRVSSCE